MMSSVAAAAFSAFNPFLKTRAHHIFSHHQKLRFSDDAQWRKLMFHADGTLKDYYSVLGVENESSSQEIQKSYYELNKVLHPDSNKFQKHNINDKDALHKLREAQEAYHVLRSKRRRAEYDSERKRITMLDHVNDIEELVHDTNQWLSKADRVSRSNLHQNLHMIHRYKHENLDPNTFIQLGHRNSVLNRKLAHEQELKNKESMDVKMRRQRTLNYKLWKERMEKKTARFTSKVQGVSINDLHVSQLSDMNRGNEQFYKQYTKHNNDAESAEMATDMKRDASEQHHQYVSSTPSFDSNVGPTPNAYYRQFNARPSPSTATATTTATSSPSSSSSSSSPSSYSTATANPETYDRQQLHTMSRDEKMKLERTTNLSAGVGEAHSDIRDQNSSNPDAYKYQRDAVRQKMYTEWRHRQQEIRYRFRKEPLQIPDPAHTHDRASAMNENDYKKNATYSWMEHMGYDDAETQLRGVGEVQHRENNNALGLGAVDARSSSCDNWLNGLYASKTSTSRTFDDASASSIGHHVLLAHIGVVCGALFFFVSYFGGRSTS